MQASLARTALAPELQHVATRPLNLCGNASSHTTGDVDSGQQATWLRLTIPNAIADCNEQMHIAVAFVKHALLLGRKPADLPAKQQSICSKPAEALTGHPECSQAQQASNAVWQPGQQAQPTAEQLPAQRPARHEAVQHLKVQQAGSQSAGEPGAHPSSPSPSELGHRLLEQLQASGNSVDAEGMARVLTLCGPPGTGKP